MVFMKNINYFLSIIWKFELLKSFYLISRRKKDRLLVSITGPSLPIHALPPPLGRPLRPCAYFLNNSASPRLKIGE